MAYVIGMSISASFTDLREFDHLYGPPFKKSVYTLHISIQSVVRVCSLPQAARSTDTSITGDSKAYLSEVGGKMTYTPREEPIAKLSSTPPG